MQEEIRYAYHIGKLLVPVFEEDYIEPVGPQPDYLDNLLKSNGIQVLTTKGLYLEESIERLREMIRPTRSTSTRSSVGPPQINLDRLPAQAMPQLLDDNPSIECWLNISKIPIYHSSSSQDSEESVSRH